MKTLFFVGRAYPHRSVLLDFVAQGYTLGIFLDPVYPLKNGDIFKTVIELDFSSPKSVQAGLAALPNDLPIDGLLCNYENYITYKVLIARHFGLPSLSEASAAACTDKAIMRTKFTAFDPKITPQFMRVDSKNDLLAFAAAHGYPIVLKPTGLVKSLLVTISNSEEELLAAYEHTVHEIAALYKKNRVTDRSPQIIAEEYITGAMCSVAAFVDSDGTPHLCEGIVELTRAKDIGLDDNSLYARKLKGDIPAHLQEKIRHIAISGIRALGMTSSPAHVEIIYNDTTAKLVEIGARIGGYRPFMYKESYGINMFEQEALVSTGDIPKIGGTFTNYTAMYELFPQRGGIFSYLDAFKKDTPYAYIHEVAQKGDTVGLAKDGFKAAAIIGISQKSRVIFDQECADVEMITVQTQ